MNKCPFCPEEFLDEGDLIRHEEQEHPEKSGIFSLENIKVLTAARDIKEVILHAASIAGGLYEAESFNKEERK